MDRGIATRRDVAKAPSPPVLGERLWNVTEVSTYLGVPVATLYQWRYLGQGPPSFRVGRHVRYDPAQLAVWLDALTAV